MILGLVGLPSLDFLTITRPYGLGPLKFKARPAYRPDPAHKPAGLARPLSKPKVLFLHIYFILYALYEY